MNKVLLLLLLATLSTAFTTTTSYRHARQELFATKKSEVLKKSEFVSLLAEELETSKKDSEDVLKTVLALVMEQVAAGKKVTLSGFGSFQPKERAARTGRNPQTGEPLQIPASVSPGFTPSKAWKEMMNSSDSSSSGGEK